MDLVTRDHDAGQAQCDISRGQGQRPNFSRHEVRAVSNKVGGFDFNCAKLIRQLVGHELSQNVGGSPSSPDETAFKRFFLWAEIELLFDKFWELAHSPLR